MPYPEHRDPRVLHQLAADQLHEQLSAIEGTDGKIAVLLSLASGLLGIAAATFALHTSATVGNHAETVTATDLWVLGWGGAIYLFIVWKGVNAYFCRDWDVGPKPLQVWDRYKTEQSDFRIEWGVTNDLIYAWDDNRAAYEKKLAALSWIFTLVAAETILLVVAIGLVAAGV